MIASVIVPCINYNCDDASTDAETIKILENSGITYITLVTNVGPSWQETWYKKLYLSIRFGCIIAPPI